MSATAATSVPQYSFLRALLFALSIGVALGGLVLLFATSWVYPLILAGAPADTTTAFLVKGVGAIMLGLAYLANVASRDPSRYVAVIDTLIIVLVLVVLLEIYEMVTRGIDSIYPHHLVLLSTIGRAALAGVLILARPRT